MEQKRIIVIGGGVAGLTAAQSARETDPEARIHLICGEPDLPYYRNRICPLLADGDKSKLSLRNFQWFIDNRVEVVRTWATAVTAAERRVKFADGSYLYYDSLVLACGATSPLPELEGEDKSHVLGLRTLEDVERARSLPGPAVVLGDGPLAVEAAWQLSRAGRSVTLVGRDRRLLARMLDKEASGFFLRLVELTDIRLALRGDCCYVDPERVVLRDGRAFPASLVLCAIGLRPQTRLGRSAGADIFRGVAVDSTMASSVEGVWAAGDCADYQGLVAGRWTAALEQGRVAGINAAGGQAEYAPEPLPWLVRAAGLTVWSYGLLEAEDAYCLRDPQGRRLVKLFLQQGRLCGAILISPGEEQPLLKLRKAVDSQATLSEARESVGL